MPYMYVMCIHIDMSDYVNIHMYVPIDLAWGLIPAVVCLDLRHTQRICARTRSSKDSASPGKSGMLRPNSQDGLGVCCAMSASGTKHPSRPVSVSTAKLRLRTAQAR